MSTPSLPNREAVRTSLQEAHIVADGDDFTMVEFPVDRDRRDVGKRSIYRVKDGGGQSCLVTVGDNLVDLFRRTEDFGSACPRLACRPIALVPHDGCDILVREFFEGETLEDRLQRSNMPTSQTRALLDWTSAALDDSRDESDEDKRNAELFAFKEQLLHLAAFTADDRRFLNLRAFPLMEEPFSLTPPCTRYTNGDFIARNIVIAATGQVRLIDYEFACRTHFFNEDWLRFGAFSTVDEPIRKHLMNRAGQEVHGWFIYLWLRQILLEERVYRPERFRAHLGTKMRMIASHISAASTTLPPAFVRDWLLTKDEVKIAMDDVQMRAVDAQLFWSTSDVWSETESEHHIVQTKGWKRIAFDVPGNADEIRLRFDPMGCIGTVKIADLCLRSTTTGQILWRATTPDAFDTLTCSGSLLRITHAHLLYLFSSGNDPQLLLPTLAGDQYCCPLKLELWMLVETDMTRFTLDLMERIRRSKQLVPAEAELDALRKERAGLADENRRLRASHDSAKKQLESLRSERLLAVTELNCARSENAILRQQRTHMERSLSWRVTSPFRRARGLTVALMPHLLNRSPNPNPGVRYHVDCPTGRVVVGNAGGVFVYGWCVSASGEPAKSVRVKWSAETLVCESIPRPDVQAYFNECQPFRGSIGFSRTVRLPRGVRRLTIEAEMPDGSVLPLGRYFVFQRVPSH